MNFIPLTEESQLLEIQELSNKPRNHGVLLFKHSYRCGISGFVLNQLKQDWNFNENDFDIYMIDVLKNRNISNRIADIYGVRHESPQILLIKHGTCVGNASHNEVSINTVNSWVK